MSSEKSRAIVLRIVEFSETSVVATLFTERFGKISALAKGARRPKSPFEAALDLLAVCRIVFLHKSSDALDLLTEAKLERRFRSAEKDLSRLYAGYYVAELLNAFTDEADPYPELFETGQDTLAALDAGGNVASLLVRMELQTLHWVGQLPALDQCASCGRSLETTPRVFFGLLAGGLLCGSCRTGQRHIVNVRAESIATLRQLLKLSEQEARNFRIEKQQLGEIRGLMNRYIAHTLGHPMRLHRFLSVMRLDKD